MHARGKEEIVMPIIEVHLLAGRSAAVRDELAGRLTRAAVEVLGVPPPSVRVLMHEVPANDWYVGGEPLSPPQR